MPILMLLTVCQSHNKRLRYSKIRTKILSMFNFLSQHIACDFETSQPLFNAASQVCSIASCGLGYSLSPKGTNVILYKFIGNLGQKVARLSQRLRY